MASHGRRYASPETIARKKAKKALHLANTRMRHIGKSHYGTNHNPAIRAYRQAGKPKKFFKFEKGMNKFQRNRVTKEATKFLHSRTSTKGGSKNVLRQTVRNILGGGSHMTKADVQKYNDFNVLIGDPQLGTSLVTSYYDVFYKVRDLLKGSHMYVPSDDIMNAITTEVEDKVSIVKNVRYDATPITEEDGSSSVQFQSYVDLMDSAELAQAVVDDLI